MPRKPKLDKALRKQIKKQELDFINTWVNFFNSDPVEYLRKQPALQSDYEKIAHDPKAQEQLRQSFRKIAEAIKNVITAYEDLWQGRAPDDGVKALQRAIEELNNLITLKVDYKLAADNAGRVSVDPVVFQHQSSIDFVSSDMLGEVARKVANFQDWLNFYKERLPIGVCRYEKCRKFFVKERKDERYCTKSHAKLTWQLEKRRTRKA
jgi:methionyl-tRNA synthetase